MPVVVQRRRFRGAESLIVLYFCGLKLSNMIVIEVVARNEETTSKIKCHGDDVVLRRVVVSFALCTSLSVNFGDADTHEKQGDFGFQRSVSF